MKGRKFNINSRKSFQRSLKHFAGKANAVNIIGVYGKSDTTSLAALPLNCRFKTCESDIQLAIFEIQADRGCSKGAGCSDRQNTGGNYVFCRP